MTGALTSSPRIDHVATLQTLASKSTPTTAPTATKARAIIRFVTIRTSWLKDKGSAQSVPIGVAQDPDSAICAIDEADDESLIVAVTVDATTRPRTSA